MASRPLWITGPTVVAALLGFASTGIAMVMLVHLLRMKWTGRLAEERHVAAFLDDMLGVRNILVAVLSVQLGTYFLWWLSLAFGGLQDQQALRVANEAYGPMFWWVGIGLGLILPLGLGALVGIRGQAVHRRLQVITIGITSTLILLGGYVHRLAVLLGGQELLPFNIAF